MKIKSITKVDTLQPISVIDCFVGDGYRQGIGGQLADVDIDYQSDRRQEIKEYLEHRYNVGDKQRVFSAGTYTTLKLKAVLKDVSRVHKVPLNIVNYITAIFGNDTMSWTDLFKLAATNKRVNSFIQSYPQVIEDIRALMGQPRSASVHASAIIITPSTKEGRAMECFDYTPIKKVDGVLVSELDGYSIDEVGLLKNDCLGIKELTKIQAVIQEVNEVYNDDITFEDLVTGDLNDSESYELLSSGYTQNIFQLSSRGMTRFLMDMRPSNINDLIAANALYRPATLESGSLEKYLDCKMGNVAPVYLWGTYNALKDTFAQLVFQEQLAQMAREVGAFSLGDGVNLVKLISKKRVDKIHAMKAKFMQGADSNGCPKEDAELIWQMIESGGSYLFNRSHATAYAITAYVGAYLKTNYPTAFYSIALEWADDKEIPTLMSEMEQCSVAKIVPPNINVSQVSFFTDYKTDEIFWSLTRIKMLGAKSVEYIVDERNESGEFTSIENFIRRIFRYKLKRYEYWNDPDNAEEAVRVPVNARHIKHMILAGCFDTIEGVTDTTQRYAILERATKELGFTLKESEFPINLVDKPYFWSMQQIAISGVGSIDYRGIYDSSDAKKQIKGKVSYLTLKDTADLDNDGRRVAICATVTEFTECSYKDKVSGERKKFAKITLQQNNDLMELIFWSDYYEHNQSKISTLKDQVIIATAIIKYSDYNGANNLSTYKTSLLFKL